MTAPAARPQDAAAPFARDHARLDRRLLWTLFAVALLGGAWANGARGADRWMSAPSYFSHHVPPHLAAAYPAPVSRSAYRAAWVGDRPGFSAASAVRINRVQFSAGGSADTTVFFSRRGQVGP